MQEKIIYSETVEFLRSAIKRDTGFLRELEEYARLHHIPIIRPNQPHY